jgi:hypothetical protein
LLGIDSRQKRSYRNHSVKKSKKKLFCTTKSESAEPIEQGVFPLSHDATDCPYKNALELKYKEWKKINCTKEKEWKNKLKNLHDKLELVSKEKTHLQKQLSVRDENEKIVTGVKGLFTHGQIKSLISQKKVRWSGDDISAAISLRSVSPKCRLAGIDTPNRHQRR